MQPSTNTPKRQQHKNTKSNNDIPLKKSTKDWTIKKETTLNDLPLISRSYNDNNTPNLKNVELQKELWNDICKETMKVIHHTDTKPWIPLIISLRKLREGVRASNWSEGNIRFSVKVYEESVHTSLRGRDFAEFRKAIRGLVDELYLVHKKGTNGHYLALDTLYQACHLDQYQSAIHQLIHKKQHHLYYNEHEINYTIQLLKALNDQNCIRFFKLYHQSPHPAYQLLLEPSIITLRQYVLKTMQKVYYMAPLSWVSTCLGLPSHEKEKGQEDTIQLIEQVYKLCIDKIEDNTIYFKKIKK
ncbi:hypothetical protein BJ944DRAFT_258973 [Cunninghamella echinulata]|nr:hypothetical protein BJ944DRAFT_258973 [Cunninghamella echinulata]